MIALSELDSEVVQQRRSIQGIVKEYNVLTGQGSIIPKGEEEAILVFFSGIVPTADKHFLTLYPGDEVSFKVEERKYRRNLLGLEFGPGKVALNVRILKAVPRGPVWRHRLSE